MDDFEKTFEQLRSTEFSRLGKQVYLDHTGSALYTNSHLQKYVNELQNNLLGNPHSGNACSERMHDIVYQARSAVLSFFNVTADEYDVVFTSGATEALRMIGSYFHWKHGSVFAYLEDNHTSVVGVRELAYEKGADSYCLCLNTSNDDAIGSSLGSYSPKLIKGFLDNKQEENFQGDEITPCLFAFPAQSNFSGAKYPLDWIQLVQDCNVDIRSILPGMSDEKKKWYIVCDAAAYVSTSPLDLKRHAADFVTISFYKIFGFPTGLGALLVKKGSENILCNKKFFGGGAVSGWLALHDFHSPKPTLHDRLEDGTISFLSILALKHGFDAFKELGLDMHTIQKYTHKLWKCLFNKLKSLKHANDAPVVEIYMVRNDSDNDINTQGPIIAFNIKRADGSFVGYNHVLQLANSNNIYLRGGCFCNVGACGAMLGAPNELLLEAYKSGHVCGDSVDVVDGKPIGALRASLGPSSTKKDVEKFVRFISNCFTEMEEMKSLSTEVSQVNETHTNIILEEIIIYPVKSCQGMVVDNWEISNTGLKYDRTWMIVDEHGICMTLKKIPNLVSIYPSVNISKEILTLRADGMKDIDVPFVFNSTKESKEYSIGYNEQCMTKVCGDKIEGLDCGEVVSLWLSEVLSRRCYLLQKSLEAHRYAKKRLSKDGSSFEISLVNEAQYLLINRSSVEFLYDNMNTEKVQITRDKNEIDGLVKRFRGNFIISGAPAFSEDSWNEFTINSDRDLAEGTKGLHFTKRGLCNRCSMICVDPNSGQKLNAPLKCLANITLNSDKTRRKPTFGIYLQCNSTSPLIKAKSRLMVSK